MGGKNPGRGESKALQRGGAVNSCVTPKGVGREGESLLQKGVLGRKEYR